MSGHKCRDVPVLSSINKHDSPVCMTMQFAFVCSESTERGVYVSACMQPLVNMNKVTFVHASPPEEWVMALIHGQEVCVHVCSHTCSAVNKHCASTKRGVSAGVQPHVSMNKTFAVPVSLLQ